MRQKSESRSSRRSRLKYSFRITRFFSQVNDKICVCYWVVYCAKASSNFVTICRVAQVQIRVAAFDRDCDSLLFKDKNYIEHISSVVDGREIKNRNCPQRQIPLKMGVSSLEIINIQPLKRGSAGPPLEFFNQSGSASRFHQLDGGSPLKFININLKMGVRLQGHFLWIQRYVFMFLFSWKTVCCV